jgi:hypothetical protein
LSPVSEFVFLQKAHRSIIEIYKLGAGGLTPSSKATWEAEIRRTAVLGETGQKQFMRPPSQWKEAGVGSVHLSSEVQKEA